MNIPPYICFRHIQLGGDIGRTQNMLGNDTLYPICEHLGIAQKELDHMAREKNILATLLSIKLHDPDLDKRMKIGRWMDVSKL